MENSRENRYHPRVESVRWVGHFPAMWKISETLYPLMGQDGLLIDLDITPSPSNSPDDLSNLEGNYLRKRENYTHSPIVTNIFVR